MFLVPTLSALALAPIFALLDARAIPRAALLERLRLDVAPDDEEARIPIHRLVHLWPHAEAVTGDADIGLHAAEHASFETFRALSSLAARSATIGAGLANVARYVRFITGLETYDLTVEDGVAKLALVRHRFIPALRHSAEIILAIPHLYCGRASTHPWSLIEVTFRHPKPASTREHARIFGCPVSFGAAEDALLFSAALLDSPSRFRDDGVANAMRATVERTAGIEEPDVVAAARLRIFERLAEGDASIGGLARAMGLSERTLQRELAAHGHSHRALLDEVRSAFANNLLRDGARLHEVALLLGFSEQTAFQRAFKRWFGVSPAKWRRES